VTPLGTLCTGFAKAMAANATASAFVARGDTLTEPTGDGVIDLAAAPGKTAVNSVLLRFFGAGGDDQTGSVRVYGVRKAGSAWVYTLLFQGTFTLSARVGVAGGPVPAAERYADTLTRTLGVENVADQVVSPTGDAAAHLLLDAKGHQKLFVEPIVGTAASVNALWAGV
jgi:hypothetical protein